MPRVKRGAKRREKRKKLLARAKGYFLGKSKLYKFAKESGDRAGNFAYGGPKWMKRGLRRLGARPQTPLVGLAFTTQGVVKARPANGVRGPSLRPPKASGRPPAKR